MLYDAMGRSVDIIICELCHLASKKRCIGPCKNGLRSNLRASKLSKIFWGSMPQIFLDVVYLCMH